MGGQSDAIVDDNKRVAKPAQGIRPIKKVCVSRYSENTSSPIDFSLSLYFMLEAFAPRQMLSLFFF